MIAVAAAIYLVGLKNNLVHMGKINPELDDSCIEEMLLLLGMLLEIVQALECLNGFGAPDAGDDFRTGNTNFSIDISDILKNASSRLLSN